MARKKGSKNKEKARIGKPRVRCSKCRKRGYRGEMSEVGFADARGIGIRNRYKHYNGVFLCSNCQQIKMST